MTIENRFSVEPVPETIETGVNHNQDVKKSINFSEAGIDSGIVNSGGINQSDSWTDDSTFEEDNESNFDSLDPEEKLVLEERLSNLKQRENAQKLDRKRHLLVTKLQHLRKCVNVLVIGPDHAGKTSLINSLGFMISRDDKGNNVWKTLAEYDQGRRYKFKQTQMWPLDQRNKIANNVRFFETGGLEKVGDIDKAATILQYALEGRLTACHLLQMFLLLNTTDITERYREDPADPRVLEERRIDAIIHVTPANQPPSKAIFKLISQALNQSKDQRIRKIPILSCVTQPHGDEIISPVYQLKDYDLGSHVRKSQEGSSSSMRRNHSLSRLSMSHHDGSTPVNLCEPVSVRKTVFYQPKYDMLNDESDLTSIEQCKEVDGPLLQLFEDTLRVAQREFPSMRKRFLGSLRFIMDILN